MLVKPGPAGLVPVRGREYSRSPQPETNMTSKRTAKSKTTTATSKSSATPSPRPESKKARLIGLLKSAKGTDVATLSTTFGWQPHTTRAALTGLRKAGHVIERLPSDAGQPARYRIAGTSK